MFLRILGSCIAILLSIVALASPARAQGCIQVDWDPGSCSGAQINNSSVDIWGRQSWSVTDGGSSGKGSTGSSGDAGASVNTLPRETTFLDMCMQNEYFAAAVVECMEIMSQWQPTQPQPPAPPAQRIITLDDFASFRPTGVGLIVEPGAWTVVGVETNLIAVADQQVVGGSLLGRAVEVRFTPATYDWAYGDGSSASTSTGGARWSALGVKEFARTATSHRYLAAGEYRPQVTVWFTVEYRWAGGSWQSVRGSIPASAVAATVTAFGADTVLVTGACEAWRVAPGC